MEQRYDAVAAVVREGLTLSEGVEDLPSHMAVYRALLCHGLIKARTQQLKG
jgi:hypothetical protein